MQRAVEYVGAHRDLSESIQAVDPSRTDLAVVPHPSQAAFTITVLSDGLGEAAKCVSSDVPKLNPRYES